MTVEQTLIEVEDEVEQEEDEQEEEEEEEEKKLCIFHTLSHTCFSQLFLWLAHKDFSMFKT